MENNPLKYKGEFETVYSIIAAHRKRVVRVVKHYLVPFRMAQIAGDEFVPIELAQYPLLCYALNRSMSPTMVAQYKEQLQVGGVIQQSLVEFCKFLSKGGKGKKP